MPKKLNNEKTLYTALRAATGWDMRIVFSSIPKNMRTDEVCSIALRTLMEKPDSPLFNIISLIPQSYRTVERIKEWVGVWGSEVLSHLSVAERTPDIIAVALERARRVPDRSVWFFLPKEKKTRENALDILRADPDFIFHGFPNCWLTTEILVNHINSHGPNGLYLEKWMKGDSAERIRTAIAQWEEKQVASEAKTKMPSKKEISPHRTNIEKVWKQVAEEFGLRKAAVQAWTAPVPDEAMKALIELKRIGFTITPVQGEIGSFRAERHDVSALLSGAGDRVVLREISSHRPGLGNARAFLKDINSLFQIDVEWVGQRPKPGEEPQGYQKFWARMAREGLVASMTTDSDEPVEADDIAPPKTL
jgi:hypothetical protein